VSSRFERTGSETKWEGKIGTVRVDSFRHEDGEDVQREVVAHPGAVGMVAHDDEHVWLVRQPREATGVPDLLEIPAGKLDEEGETPLQTARRELAEEIGKKAGSWRELKRFFTSPGFTDEEVVIFEATELTDADTEPDPGERIEIVAWPLERLDEAIEECRDSKSLIGLLLLRQQRT
jgi:ADP-ribose pyrophosphatase